MLVINNHFDKVNYIITVSLNLASHGIILHDRGFSDKQVISIWWSICDTHNAIFFVCRASPWLTEPLYGNCRLQTTVKTNSSLLFTIQNRYARFDKWFQIIRIRGVKYRSLYRKRRCLGVVLVLSSMNELKQICKFNADLRKKNKRDRKYTRFNL